MLSQMTERNVSLLTTFAYTKSSQVKSLKFGSDRVYRQGNSQLCAASRDQGRIMRCDSTLDRLISDTISFATNVFF